MDVSARYSLKEYGGCRRLLHVLRKTMLEIGGGIHGAAINEEKLHDQFMSFVETSQALIYGRAITEEEHDDLWEFHLRY